MESSRGPDSGPTGGSKVIDRISIFGGVDLLQLSAVSSSSCLLSYFSSELLPLSPMIPVNWMLLINSCSNFVPLQLCSCCADKCFFNTMPLLLGYSSVQNTKLSAAKRGLKQVQEMKPKTLNYGFLEKRIPRLRAYEMLFSVSFCFWSRNWRNFATGGPVRMLYSLVTRWERLHNAVDSRR